MNKINDFFKHRLRDGVPFLSTILAAFEFALPLLLGVTVGWFGASVLESYLSPRSAELQMRMSAGMAAAQSMVSSNNGMDDFLSANPFSVTPRPSASAAPEPTQPPVQPEVKDSFSTASLTGTFPDIGAWMRDVTNNEVEFIPIGDNYEAYQLSEVMYDRAVFRKEDKDITKYLYIVTEAIPGQPAPRPAAPAPTVPAPAPQSVFAGQVSAPSGQGRGTISREVINKLLENPFDEMKNVRIRPKFDGNTSLGLEVQMLKDESVLGSLGVKKGDVIQSINNIPLKNMGDISNAISSLMSSTTFDVEVMRDANKTDLNYDVK